MKYQLVLQWPAASIEDYDAMIELEDRIIDGLGPIGNVDGHDAGSGEMNIFIHTDDPRAVFEKVRQIVAAGNLMPDLKAAYRLFGSDEFTIIHPEGLNSFCIA